MTFIGHRNEQINNNCHILTHPVAWITEVSHQSPEGDPMMFISARALK
jgi:hypothetical protein